VARLTQVGDHGRGVPREQVWVGIGVLRGGDRHLVVAQADGAGLYAEGESADVIRAG
jgi:hypothetical protein